MLNIHIQGPALKTWYMILDRTVKGAAATTMLKKVALDQVLNTHSTPSKTRSLYLDIDAKFQPCTSLHSLVIVSNYGTLTYTK